ncbi:MAG: ATP-binding protein [Pontibacterium sp.]
MADIWLLLGFGLTYLLCLFGAAFLTERQLFPPEWVQHPLIHTLSMGVYISIWTFYGAFSLAGQSGYLFLATYLGAAAAFMLAPAILTPILKLCRNYQLSSLADLLAFRFRSGTVGLVVTALTVFATLPLISIQIQAVSDTLHLVDKNVPADQLALGFCLILAIFSMFFGSRHASGRQPHPGLVVAMAMGSAIKLLAVLCLGIFAIAYVHNGLSGLEDWLDWHPDQLADLSRSADSNTWRTLLIACFGALVVMPHTFHMLFTENESDKTLLQASWSMPLYLLLLALPVLPILWAGERLGLEASSGFLMIRLSQEAPTWLTLLTFIGGLSAASGLTIVATVAMASMIQNHVVLPRLSFPDGRRFYLWLLWMRRSTMLFLLLASYLFYRTLGTSQELHHLGILAALAFVQFLPGVLATLYWKRANRLGLLVGLLSGTAVWVINLAVPMVFADQSTLAFDHTVSSDNINKTASLSLLLNCLFLITLSLLTKQSKAESDAADACLRNTLSLPSRSMVKATHADDFVRLLTPRLGQSTAQREVRTALKQLRLSHTTLKPIDVIHLRNQLNHNLTALLGPVESRNLLLPLDHLEIEIKEERPSHLLETQYESHQQARLTGLAAELNILRKHHKETLQRLPVGVCTLNHRHEIVFWNAEMARFTSLSSHDCFGQHISQLPEPWSDILSNFVYVEASTLEAQSVDVGDQVYWYSLNKTQLSHDKAADTIIVLEDETRTRELQHKLAHNERLSSIGRFAAGVAHEIGNPVTGIACLAQNLQLETDQPDILETGDQIVAQTQRISNIVQSLVRFAHVGQGTSTPIYGDVNIHSCVDEAISLVSLDHREKSIYYHNDTDPTLVVEADNQQLLQVFVNLLNNARDASPTNSRVTVRASHMGRRAKIEVEDQGTGIPDTLKSQLFEPFFTTKDPGEGTGLGLPLVYNIIEEHYGSIDIYSPANNKENKGTCVVITLPKVANTDSLEQ